MNYFEKWINSVGGKEGPGLDQFICKPLPSLLQFVKKYEIWLDDLKLLLNPEMYFI